MAQGTKVAKQHGKPAVATCISTDLQQQTPCSQTLRGIDKLAVPIRLPEFAGMVRA